MTGNHKQQRKAMEQRARELNERLKNSRQGLHVENAPDLLDNLQLAADREFEVERLMRDSEQLSLVQRAMDTLKAGNYGVCLDCEEAIAPKRLQVMPWAVRCVACQQRYEEQHSSTHSMNNAPGAWELQTA